MRTSQKKELTKYVADMLKHGHNIQGIKKQLENHGYTKKIIEETFIEPVNPIKKELETKSEDDALSHGEKIFILCFGVALFLFIIWLGLMTSASVLVIFISFMPSLVTILVTYIMYEESKKRYKNFVWIIPVVMIMLFIYLAKSGILPPLANIDAGNIAILNLIIAAAFLFMINVLPSIAAFEIGSGDREYYKPAVHKRKTTHIEKHDVKASEKGFNAVGSEEELGKYIQSIEDKSKALNFVIGRVYSVKHGGTKDIRNKIKIKSEWYNEFNTLQKSGRIIQDLSRVKDLVHRIYEQLRLLLNTEEQVFGQDYKKLKIITRDPNGGSRVVDVLVVNDQDPVQTYYQSALDFCHKAVQELKMIAHKKK